MGLSAKKAYGAAKAYTDETVIGGGALKGKNCVINSITDISATSSHPAGKRVTFGWTLDDGTEQSSYMDIFNGNDGEGIDHMYVNAEGHLIVVYDSGDEEDCGEITIPSSQADWNETDPEENSYIKNKPNISAIIDAVGNNTNAIGVINQQLSTVIAGVSNNTSAISSITSQLSSIIDDVGTNTSAINTINRDLEARANIKTIGTGLNLDSSGELTATGGGGGTTDYSDLTNKPSINNVTLSGNKTSADLGFGTASALNVAASGDASTTEVVKGDDSRLTDARNAADVYSWAKASTKPTYTASEVGAVATSVVGTASGVAELDATGKVPSSQLPSYVDDVVDGYYKEADGKFYEESTYETEIVGESGKIYISVDTDIQYRWTGSAFSAMGGGLVLGETSSTAYRGDRGKTAYDFSQNPATASPLMDGTAAVGSSGKWAKEDHVHPSDTAKADKVASATNGNFAGLDANGNLTDSGKKPSDYTPTFTGTQAEWTAEQNKSRYTIVNITDDTSSSGGGSSTEWKLEDDYSVIADDDFDIWLRKADIFDGDLRIDIVGFDRYGNAAKGFCTWFIPNWVLVDLWDCDGPMYLEEKSLYFYEWESDTDVKTTCAFTLEGNMKTSTSERIYYKLIINALITAQQQGNFQVNVYTNSPTFQPTE